jgi:hypothetical protein
MNNPDHIFESLETVFWVKILKFFDADPGWKKFLSWINIPDPQHWYLLVLSPDKYGEGVPVPIMLTRVSDPDPYPDPHGSALI